MTPNDAVLYIILVWPIGFIFLYFLFGKWLGPEKEEEPDNKLTSLFK